MNSFSMLINIDETLFSRTTKATYSWSAKGKECPVNNIGCSNSFFLISAILSTGFVNALGSTESVNGWIFTKFLNGLRGFIEEKIQIDIREWLIILDNASTHHSKLVTDYINRQKLCVAFIPAYSPELAPIIKYFALLKRMVSKEASKTRINWKNKNSMTLIKRSMKQIPSRLILNIWGTLWRNWLALLAIFKI